MAIVECVGNAKVKDRTRNAKRKTLLTKVEGN